MDKIHQSKVDNWLLMLVVSVALLVLLAATLLALSGWAPLGFILFVFAAVLPMWIAMATRYHIIDNELRVRAGPFRWRIPLDYIDTVEPCHNAALAPAMSKERLWLSYRDASGQRFGLLVSPEDRYQFIFDLGIVEPDLADDDDAQDDQDEIV